MNFAFATLGLYRLPELQLHYILDVMGMREHINGLYPGYGIFQVQPLQVTGLGGGVTTDINHGGRPYFQDLGDQLFAHAGAGRISDDNVRPALLFKETILAEGGDVTGKEPGVTDAVQGGVLPGVFNSFTDDLDPDDPGRPAADEDADTASSAVQVVYGLLPAQLCVVAGDLIKSFPLPGIGLEEGLGADLELKIFQSLDHISFSKQDPGLQVGDAIVPFGIDRV